MTPPFDPEAGPFLNAHCHLELGHLRGAITPGLDFVSWLERLVQFKKESSLAASTEGAREGISLLRATGTDAICDVVSMYTSVEPLREASREGMKTLAFREILTPHPLLADEAVETAILQETAGVPWGLSPHAPHTTSAPLLRRAAREAREAGRWLCIHAAETGEEVEVMMAGTGPLREFGAEFYPADWSPPGMRPIEYLHECGCLGPRTLLAHVNHAADHEVELIRRTGTSVVVCPGAHCWFGRGEFPLRRLLDAGVRVYLGTDSLASNWDLDMRKEVRLAAELTPGVDPARIAALADARRAGDFISV